MLVARVALFGSYNKTSVQVFCTNACLGGKATLWLKPLLQALYRAAIATNSWIQVFKFLDINFVTASFVLVALVALLSLGGQTVAWTGVGLGSIPCMRV